MRPEVLEGDPEVGGVPAHDGVHHQRQAQGLTGLRLAGAAAHGAVVGEEQIPAQRVQALALVELAPEAPPVGLVGQIPHTKIVRISPPYSTRACASAERRPAACSLATTSDAVNFAAALTVTRRLINRARTR